MTIVLGILLAGILSNNYALLKFLGTGAVVEKAYSAKKSLILGLGTTLVMVLCTLITWPLNTYLLASVSYLQTMVFVAVLLAVVQILYVLGKKRNKCCCAEDFAKLTVSGAVLGLCVENTALDLGTAVVTAAAVGIGYMLAVTLYGKLRTFCVDDEAVPAPFRGLPISLLTAGMIVLALLALQFKF